MPIIRQGENTTSGSRNDARSPPPTILVDLGHSVTFVTKGKGIGGLPSIGCAFASQPHLAPSWMHYLVLTMELCGSVSITSVSSLTEASCMKRQDVVSPLKTPSCLAH